MSEGVKRRRRGATLESEVLDAAWAEIEEHGYHAYTVDGVAARAGTSKAVLYRRWSGKAELARAALERLVRRDPMTAPDTGSLRGDVIAFLEQANERRVEIAAQVLARLGELQEATGTTIADLRGDETPAHEAAFRCILDRAVDRGEADPARLTERVVRLPADLFRLELLTTRRAVPHEDLVEIVDTVFLPLVR